MHDEGKKKDYWSKFKYVFWMAGPEDDADTIS